MRFALDEQQRDFAASIDAALASAMSDRALNTVIQQYYGAAINSRMVPSHSPLPPIMYTDTVESLVGALLQLVRSGRQIPVRP